MSKHNKAEEEISVLGHDESAFLLPFLQAAEESTKSNIATIRSIVMKLLSEPNIFAGYDQIKAILQPTLLSATTATAAGSEGDKLLQSLDLFSYGTYTDYLNNPLLYLDLTGAQVQKLRQLSVLTVVQQGCTSGLPDRKDGIAMIPYKDFEVALQLPTTAAAAAEGAATESTRAREVEDMLVSCLCMGVFRGKLCQQSRSLHLSPRHTIRPRDVPVSQIAVMVEQIRKMQSLLQNATLGLDARKEQVNDESKRMAAFWKQVDERRKKNENAALLRWDTNEISFGGGGLDGGGNTRRQKRGRATANNNTDPSTAFSRFQA